jgi:hypothetical protein
VEPPLLEKLQSLEADPPPMEVLRLLSAEVLPLGALLVCWESDVPPFGNPMFTVGGRAAVMSPTVTWSGHAAVGRGV